MASACVLVYLTVSTGLDIRKKEVSVVISVIFCLIAVLYNLYTQLIPLTLWISGVLPGVLLLLTSWFTGGSIGTGDGLVMLVCGLFLGIWKGMELLLAALFISALFSLVLIVVKRAGKKDTIPFVPFIMAAYLILLVIQH